MRRVRVAGVGLALLCAGCAQPDSGPLSAGAPVRPAGASAAQAPGPWRSHVLLTHCGIRETRFEGAYWVTEPELHDGSHDPPAGWDNPEQRGRMRRLSPDEAEFRDREGHVVLFRLRPGATDLQMCA